MTTIVACAQRMEMAADTRCTGGGPMCNVQKIFPLGQSIIGIAGDVFAALTFLDWLGDKRKKPPKFEDEYDCFIALQLTPSGIVLWNGRLTPLPIKDSCYAIGSGAMAAMQSARKGSTLTVAIQEACTLDEGSGGAVETMKLTVNKKCRLPR
jgi:hypothetical protein